MLVPLTNSEIQAVSPKFRYCLNIEIGKTVSELKTPDSLDIKVD